MSENKDKIQEINFQFITNFLNQLTIKIWQGTFSGKKYNKNEIWNIMYLFDNKYLKSSYQDDSIPVVYSAMAQHPTVTPITSAITNRVLYNKETIASLDSNSRRLMTYYSDTRKYVRGYYFEIDETSENIKEFKFYDPQITERGIELLKFLNEKELIKRKKMWENLLRAGAEVIKFIAPLILQLLN